MRWEDESYIRWYRRNTPEWCLLSWQARGLFGLIMREVDRAGLLELGKVGLKAVAVVTRSPWDEIERHLAELIEDGCVVHRADLRILLVPNFIAAQEANASDKARQRAARERARDLARARSLAVLETSRNVAPTSQSVTTSPFNGQNSHSYLIPSDPIQTHPILRGGVDDASPEAQRPDEPEPPKRETGFDIAQRLYAEAYRKRYGVDFMLTDFGHKGSDEFAFMNLGRLAEGKGDPERWLRHWMRAYLKDDEKWLRENAHPPRQLEKRLNKYGEPKKPRPKTVEELAPVEPPRTFTKLEPVTTGGPPVRKASTPEELAEKARADKARLLATYGNGKP